MFRLLISSLIVYALICFGYKFYKENYKINIPLKTKTAIEDIKNTVKSYSPSIKKVDK